MQNSGGAQALSRRLGAVQHSAGAQQRARSRRCGTQGRSNAHEGLRGRAALSRRSPAQPQQAVQRSGGAQVPSRRSRATQRSGALRGRSGGARTGAQGLCRAQQAPSCRRSAGAQGLCSTLGTPRRPGGVLCLRAQAASRLLGLCGAQGAPWHPAGTQPALSRRPGGVHTQGALRRSPGAQGLCSGAQQQAPSRRYSAQGALRRPSGAQELCNALQALSCGRLVGGAALKGRSGARQAIRGCAALRGHSGVLTRPASAQGLCCAQWALRL